MSSPRQAFHTKITRLQVACRDLLDLLEREGWTHRDNAADVADCLTDASAHAPLGDFLAASALLVLAATSDALTSVEERIKTLVH